MERDGDEISTWLIPNYVISSFENGNICSRHADIDCMLIKMQLPLHEISLFDKYILGYRDYYYIISYTIKEPIRGTSEEYKKLNNDRIKKNYYSEERSIDIIYIKRNREPNLSVFALNNIIANDINSNNNTTKRTVIIDKILLEKKFRKNSIKLSLLINRWHDSPSAGLTDIFSINIRRGYRIYDIIFTLFGLSIEIKSISIYNILSRLMPKYYPRTHMQNINEYIMELDKESEDDLPVKIDSTRLGVNRKLGFFYVRVNDSITIFTHKNINPWRNKFWNII